MQADTETPTEETEEPLPLPEKQEIQSPKAVFAFEDLEIVAVDIETTGLSAERDEIIEIAAIRFVGGEIVGRFDSFVKPRGKVPKFIEYLTHISSADLKSAPPVKDVLQDFCKFLGNSIVVGHNIPFDLGFINHNLVRSGSFPLINKNWDTVEIAKIYLPTTTDHKLSSMVAHFAIELNNAHRADADAIATGKLFFALTEHILQHYNFISNARIMDLSQQAQLEGDLFEYLKKIVTYQRQTAIGGKPVTHLKSKLNNVLEHEVKGQIANIPDVFSEHGLFSERFPNFEFRSGQMDMAAQIANAFKSEEHLVVEAGTGVGKSFAYLVPAMEFSRVSGAKVVVSTNTKNLQEQLFYKDLPQLKQMLPLPFKAVLVKGRENYICERRWEELLLEQTKGLSPYEAQALMYLFVWKQLSNTGDVSENSSFDRKRFSMVWRKICSDRYLCGGRKCPNFLKCHVMKLRKDIETASIVVANHSLLLADAQMEKTTLGEYGYLIIDEAHNLMGAASKHLGFDLGFADFNSLFNQLSYGGKRQGFLHQLGQTVKKSMVTDANKEHVEALIAKLNLELDEQRRPLTNIFNQAAMRCSAADSYGKLRIKATSAFDDIFEPLGQFSLAFKNIMKDMVALNNVLSTFNNKHVANLEAMKESLTAFTQRFAESEEKILNLLNPDLDNYALWIESNTRPDRNFPTSSLCYAPVEVSSHLHKLLYSTIPCIVFTSATLALRGSFRYFMNQSGLSLTTEKVVRQSIVDSPFDYDKQSLLLIGSFLPEHKDKYFQNQALGCLEQIFKVTNVGTMALFTSYRDLDTVYDHLGDGLYHANRPFFAQGKGGSRSSMLDEFKKSKNAVLLGTSSFWEGVDIQGESLSLLILYKIPFQVPSEPLVEALIDKLERENKDSFMHFMLPNALLRIRQGFGRLIRSKTDRGVVLIMDSRVSKKRYGEYFKQILPGRCIELHDEQHLVSEIGRFFNGL
ncbi:MAG: helicase C-terminal domain-containing protein [Candidatus Cloacimonas sp.]|jgi:ATP-dependent DNA helicase DinG|nr:helicase C-terminal domain-containing protein [Candidatus Cloacimonas sp.]